MCVCMYILVTFLLLLLCVILFHGNISTMCVCIYILLTFLLLSSNDITKASVEESVFWLLVPAGAEFMMVKGGRTAGARS